MVFQAYQRQAFLYLGIISKFLGGFLIFEKSDNFHKKSFTKPIFD